MALSSMTGFARSHGASGPYAFEWELKSVNAKGFDLRLRLPPGWDELEAFAKKRAGEVLSRGTVYANLNVKRANAVSTIRINEDVLSSIVKVAGQLAGRIDAVAPSIDGLLSIKGVIEVVEPESNEEEDKAAKDAAAAAFEQALAHLVEMRRREGITLLGKTEPSRVAYRLVDGAQQVEQPDDGHERRVENRDGQDDDRQEQGRDGRPCDRPAGREPERAEREAEYLAAAISHEDGRRHAQPKVVREKAETGKADSK